MNGLMVQILSGLITYLLLAIYCQEQHGEPVSIHRVLQLRNQIRNEVTQQAVENKAMHNRKRRKHLKRLKKPHAIS
jgi:hypothetical protein